MREPRIKGPTEAVMKPNEVEAELPMIQGHASEDTSREWFLMDTAPMDGTAVEVKSDPDDAAVRQAKWYMTRMRDPKQKRWVPTGWWVDPVTNQKLDFEPFMWRMMEGFYTPPGEAA